jgi:hypothetical protein
MTDEPRDGHEPDRFESTAETETAALPHASSTYKVLGELAAHDGTGVLGHNTAASGTAVGVQGVTDSASGYGLYTPDDARVGGELVVDLSLVGSAIVGSNNIAAGAVTSSELADGTIGTADLGQNGASAGEGLVWDGTQWTTGDVGGWAAAPATPALSDGEMARVESLYEENFGVDRDDGMDALRSSVGGADLEGVDKQAAGD